MATPTELVNLERGTQWLSIMAIFPVVALSGGVPLHIDPRVSHLRLCIYKINPKQHKHIGSRCHQKPEHEHQPTQTTEKNAKHNEFNSACEAIATRWSYSCVLWLPLCAVSCLCLLFGCCPCCLGMGVWSEHGRTTFGKPTGDYMVHPQMC